MAGTTGVKGNVFRYKTKVGTRWGYKVCVNYKQIVRQGFITRDQAFSAMSNFKGEDVVNLKKYTFKMAMGAWLDMQSNLVKKTTLMHYKHITNKHFADFPKKSLDEIKYRDLYAWFSAKKVSLDMKIRILALVEKIFDYAEVYFKVRNVEYKKLYIPKEYKIIPVKEKKVLTSDEFMVFYNALKTEYWRVLFTLTFMTGIRVGEVRGLQIKCLDLDQGIMHIIQEANSQVGEGRTVLHPPKSSSSNRTYYLPDFVVDLLKDFIEHNHLKGDDFLFFGTKRFRKAYVPNYANPVGTMTIYRAMDKAQQDAKIPHFNFHYFRHSEASFLNEKGISQESIADYLGHDSVAVTRKYYIHDSSEKKVEIRDLLQQKFSGYFSKSKKED